MRSAVPERGRPSDGVARTDVVPRDEPHGFTGKLDAAQRRVPGLSFVVAVVRKYNDDTGGRLVALLTYSSFLSLFPLLLVLTTILGYALGGSPHLQEQLRDSALSQFPIIGDQLKSNVTSLHGSVLALVIGLATAIWGGMGVTQQAQDILADVWMVPRRDRPNFVHRLVKALGVMLLLAAGLVSTTVISSAGTGLLHGGAASHVALPVLSVAINVVWFGLAFRVLIPADVRWTQVWPGALVAAVGWELLLLLGSWLVDRQLRGATQSYGFFGIVLGLVAWLSLLSTVLVLAAEVNAVLAHRLWPRSLLTPDLTENDQRALEGVARVQERAPDERVHVQFHDDGEDGRASTPIVD